MRERASATAARARAASPGEGAGAFDLAALARLDEGLRALSRGPERAA